jgi:hypothetical protein
LLKCQSRCRWQWPVAETHSDAAAVPPGMRTIMIGTSKFERTLRLRLNLNLEPAAAAARGLGRLRLRGGGWAMSPTGKVRPAL